MGEGFKNGDQVKISRSGEKGRIVGESTYLEGPDLFLVEYTAGDGCARNGWFKASELEIDEAK